jgi:probable F420-dependent oxidoreductase
VLDTDAERARALGRRHLANPYMTLPNYVDNWIRQGFESADVENGGSDRLVDALVAWGDPETVAARLAEHHDAGADHVGVQLLGEDPLAFPREGFRTLAGVLF